MCYRHRTNGGCTNGFHIAAAEVNEAVLQAIEEHALTPSAIEQVVMLSQRSEVADQQAELDRERLDVQRRIDRLVAVIETGGDAMSLAVSLRQLEARQRDLVAQAASLRPIPRLPPAVIEDRLAEWRRLLRASTTQGRTVLQRILRGRLTFTLRRNPISGEIDGYDFEGPTRYDKLFTGIAVERPKSLVYDTAGCEGIGPEDTFDGDYGRLLENALKGFRPQREPLKGATCTSGDMRPKGALGRRRRMAR